MNPNNELKRSKYCFEMVSLQVEDEVYYVPRHGFTQLSEVFEAMFSFPQPKGSLEGRDISHPIVLPSYNKWEFETLLDVLYPVAPRVQPIPLWKDQWVCVLRLSNMWAMDKLRIVAIEEISKIQSIIPCDLVSLAKEHGVSQWLIRGYVETLEMWRKEGHGSRWREKLGDLLKEVKQEFREEIAALPY